MQLTVIVTPGAPARGHQLCMRSLEEQPELASGQILTGKPGEALSQASGGWVVVLSNRYRPQAGWAAAILREHGNGADVVAGCVAPAATLSYFGWCAYLAEYSHLAPPMNRQPDLKDPRLVAAGNVSYRRDLVASVPSLDALEEVSFHRSLLDGGARICFAPDMAVEFVSSPSLGEYARERFQRSRTEAAVRANDIGRGRASVAAFARLALPPLLVARLLRDVARRGRYRIAVLACLPVLTAFALWQMVAEMGGYLFPPRGTERI